MLLDQKRGEEWCEYVDCDEEWEERGDFPAGLGKCGVLAESCGGWTGDERTIHAGLPVTSGAKSGMNIWTRQGALDERFRGRDEEN